MTIRTAIIFTLMALTGMFAVNSFADTFKNIETGETFTGFMTQKSTGGRTLVYNADAKELVTINTAEYTVTYNAQGRKDIVVVIPITESEVLLSRVVSETIAEAIIDASNKGPLAIILEIDNPGGRGDYMKIIASAVSQTQNCPVTAYISGQRYGGAFSGAAMIAVACDKVYIAPTASIGAIGPIVGITVSEENFADYLATYASDSLTSYNIYATALAQDTGRPPLVVRALIDKHLSVLEVENIDKTRDFIQKDNRQPTQNIIRTLAEGVPGSLAEQAVNQAAVLRSVLNLPPSTAIEVGVVDGVADSVNALLSDLNMADAKLTNTSGIDNVIKKYKAARRNLAESLTRIDWLESRSSLLVEQLSEIENQLRTGTVTREVTRRESTNSSYYRNNIELPENYNSYYYDPGVLPGGQIVNRSGGSYSNRSNDMNRLRKTRESETIITQMPAASIDQVQRELVAVLNDLIVQYRRAMSQAKRWPGSLPPGLPYQALEQNMDSAAALRNYLLRQPGIQQQIPVNPPVNRRNY